MSKTYTAALLRTRDSVHTKAEKPEADAQPSHEDQTEFTAPVSHGGWILSLVKRNEKCQQEA